MKLLFFITCMVACIISGIASASSYDSRVQALYSDKLVEAIIKGQIQRHSKRTVESYGSIRTIDGSADAIEINQERTGLPSDYLALPTSKRDMERYNYGR